MARSRGSRLPKVDIKAVCDCHDIDIRGLRRYARAVMLETGHEKFELSMLLADDVYVRKLNKRYRNVDRTTNVLAFPQDDDPETSHGPAQLGDVVISVEKARRDSARQGHGLLDELKRLTVHGVLHLAGHDHRTQAETRRMRQLEREVMRRVAN